jgi:hypothetical protein
MEEVLRGREIEGRAVDGYKWDGEEERWERGERDRRTVLAADMVAAC